MMYGLVLVELPEGIYYVPGERLQLQPECETMLWLRDAWRVVRAGGPPANDVPSAAEVERLSS